MTCWSQLPIDILGIVFEYVLEDNGKNTTRVATFYRLKDIRQCQQTCKNWAGIARMNLYKNVALFTNKSIKLFICTLIKYELGSLVKTVAFFPKRIPSSTRLLPSLLQQIGYLCPDLKKFTARLSLCVALWKCIQIERSKGSFSKLQVLASPPVSNEHQLTQYYEVAYSLRETLRELTIYYIKSVPIKNIENFTNICTLYFKLDYFGDIYTLAQQIERCRSVKTIHIEYNDHSFRRVASEDRKIRNTKISPPVYTCPKVEQLFIKNITFDTGLPGYLMKVFPNLNKLELDFEFYGNRKSQLLYKISNNTALQFLGYLTKMSSASVNYFPVEDVNELLKNFQDINGTNRHLSISYTKEDYIEYPHYYYLRFTEEDDIPDAPYLTVSTKQKIDITVYTKNEKIDLRRIGMIESSGKKLQSLTLNTGLEPKSILDNRTDFYHIFLYCPNLKNIHILNTPLRDFGKDLQQKQELSLRTFTLEGCYTFNLFFTSLSYHINYINTLTIRNADFLGSLLNSYNNDYKCINMPETAFDRINYFDRNNSVYCIFLKLKKTGDDNVGWFVSKNNGFEKCIEEDYEASLKKQHSMSFFICCTDIRTIEFGYDNIKATFKT